MLNFLAFRLFFVQLGLEFTSHAVVAVLSVLQVEAHLVYICQRVQILVVAHHLVRLGKLLLFDRLTQDYSLLEALVHLFELFVLGAFVKYCLYELTFHLVLVEQVTCSVVHFVHIVIISLVIVFS